MMKCSVIKVPARSPNDMSALQRYIDESLINPKEVVAVLGKTEGNGCVNDFTRGFAVLALKNLFATYKETSAEPVSFVMSG